MRRLRHGLRGRISRGQAFGHLRGSDAPEEGNGQQTEVLGHKTRKHRYGTEQTANGGSLAAKVTLSSDQKNELHIFEAFKEVVSFNATKLRAAFPSSAGELTMDQVVDFINIKSQAKGFQRVASTLRSAYTGCPYEEVDRDLEAIIPFKKGSQPLPDETAKILTRLGLLGTPTSSDSVAPSDETSSTPETTTHATVPETQSIIIETPKDFLELKPDTVLADEGHGDGKARQPKTPSRVVRKINKSFSEKSEIPAREKMIAVMKGNQIRVASAEKYPLTPLIMETSEVPRLSHDLSRVLFNPGVYQLQDPRSRVWNFDPYLGTLMPVSEFNYDALNKYITSSEDVHLREVALKYTKRYIGSTSSMSGVLSHFHFLLSAFRPLNLENLTRGFQDDGVNFTRIQKGPTAIFLRYKDGVYAIDADKEFDSANILMSLGRSMEKLLTSDKDEFEQYRRTEDAAKDAQMKASQPEAYHYSALGEFLLRSQLDAHDPRLPGTGMFDLKTRAVAAVRMMVRDHEKGVGYQIKERFGTWESYEREYYDMMRSAFLKYSLQVRMGRMDGIFVAYHNTERLFGFQYVPLSEMDFALHGQSDRILGDQEFSLSIQLLNYIFNEATMKYPGQSLRFHFEARDATAASPQYMYVFAEPVTEEEIVAIQTLKKEEIRAFEERIFHPMHTEALESSADGEDETELEGESEAVESSTGEFATSNAKQNASMPISSTSSSNAANVAFLDDILGVDINEAMAPKSDEEPNSEAEQRSGEGESNNNIPGQVSSTTPSPIPESGPNKPLSAWKLNIRNIVNGLPVIRPENFKGGDTWSLQYTLNSLSESEARRHYMLCKNRRKATLEAPQDTDEAANFYLQRLISLSRGGAQWRRNLDQLDAKRERIVLYGE